MSSDFFEIELDLVNGTERVVRHRKRRSTLLELDCVSRGTAAPGVREDRLDDVESGEDLSADDGRVECPNCRGTGRVAAEEEPSDSSDENDVPAQRIAAQRRAQNFQ